MAGNDMYNTGSSGGDYTYFNLPSTLKTLNPSEDGAVLLDVIPYKIASGKNWAITQGSKVGDEALFASVFVHQNVGPSRKKVICPNKTYGGKCPICEQQQALAKEKGWKDADVKSLFPKQRLVFNVMVHNDKGEKVHMLWDIPQFKGAATISVFDSIMSAADKIKLRKKLEFVDWASPTAGYSVECSVVMKNEIGGTKTKTPFPTYLNFGLVGREEQYGKGIMDDTIDPMKFAKLFSYEEIEKMFYASEATDNEEEEETTTESQDHEMNSEPEKEPEDKAPKSISVPPKEDTGMKCEFGLRFGKDFNQSEECADACGDYLSCRRANKALQVQ